MTDDAIILVHSPVVGPRTWASTAEALARQGHRVILPALRLAPDAEPPCWRQFVDRAIEAVGAGLRSAILVAHSAAGPLLPAIEDRLRVSVRSCVFVDATIPARSGSTPVVPPQFLGLLRDRAQGGKLPRWSQWWGDEVMASLVPDPALRRAVEEEMPSLPLGCFEEAVPVPAGWPASRCSYLQLSELYEGQAAEARSRGWPAARLAGGHLHMLVDPTAVANAILDLAGPEPG